MKRGLTLIINIAVIAFIIFFITMYTSQKREERNAGEIQVYQSTADTAGRIITNYLSDEQHLCDVWASYINNFSKETGQPMTISEAVGFTQRATASAEIEAHIVFYDDGSFTGLSSAPSLNDPEDYKVSYRNQAVFSTFSEEFLTHDIRQTVAFTNPKNGIPSMAFLNLLTLSDENSGAERKALLMRIIPISEISRKLIYLKGEYEDMELAIIDIDGDYMIHGSQLKNSNFFEYYKSYNNVDYVGLSEFILKVTGETGTVEITGSKGQKCVVAHTPVTSNSDWFLISIIPKAALLSESVVDWRLLGATIGALTVLLIFNMSAMMLFNRRLAVTANEAEKANAAKSKFLSMMSHDIRTPMNAITGFNEMIRRESTDPEILRYSEGIRMADNTLLSLINDILDLSKLEAGKLEIIPVEYDLVMVLSDLVNMIKVRTEEKNLSLKIDIDSNIPRRLYGDELRLKQCVINLLTNAVKYTHEGSVSFTVGYEKCPDNDNEMLLKISVADTGLGIRPEDIDKLFEAFKRLEEKKNRNIEGSGLGLSITQSLLSLMGASLEVKSEYGRGSEFSFAVRQEIRGTEIVGNYEEAFSASMEGKGRYRQSFTAPDARVLVVDDTPLNLNVFVSLLKATGIRTDTAGSGSECLGLCTENAYDVIFLDHMMPEMDGIETLHALKALKTSKNETTPVICLTANAISGMREMFLEEGFNDYLSKPIDYVRLEELLVKYIPEDKITEEYVEHANENETLPDGLSDIPGINAAAGLKHCGNAASYIDTLRLYCDAAQKNCEEIRNYWNTKDIKNLTIKLHALKSTSNVIGAEEVGELAAELEKAGKQGDADTISGELERLLLMHEKLTAKLSPVVSITDGKDELLPISKEELDKEYERLLAACADFDYDTVVRIVDELSHRRVPADETERMEAVMAAVDGFDYDLIPEIITPKE